MNVRIEERSLLGELVDYLRRCDCIVGFKDGLLQARPRQLPSDAAARFEELELDSYLKVFCALHPGVHVELIPERATQRPRR
jgi:hypothetical protein